MHVIMIFHHGAATSRQASNSAQPTKAQLQSQDPLTKEIMLGYFLALLPLYVFVYLPLSNSIYGKPKEPSNEDVQQVLNSSFVADDIPLSCPSHTYNTYILSHEPLMIYIENFLSPEESEHLLKIRYIPPFQISLNNSYHVTNSLLSVKINTSPQPSPMEGKPPSKKQSETPKSPS